MRRVGALLVAGALLAVVTGCGGGSDDSSDGKGGGKGSGKLASVDVTVRQGASVDANKRGGDELGGVTFGDPARAICSTGERIGVIPKSVDRSAVDSWTNATEEPVVFVYPEDLNKKPKGLPACSDADGPDDLDTTVLHGKHAHASRAQH